MIDIEEELKEAQIKYIQKEKEQLRFYYRDITDLEFLHLKFDHIIDANDGAATQYMRVEMSGGTIHGHPITKAECLKLTK